MSKTARLKALLGSGYFPEELPPPFNTIDFARFRNSIGTKWAAIGLAQYPKTTPEIFSNPKPQGWRRDLSIVNPIAQYHLANLIAENWNTIRKSFANTYSSESITINTEGERSIPKPDFELVRLRHSDITALYDYVLIADISRFYGTLYTHAIPWALESKAWCKSNLSKPIYEQSLGARLDKCVRKGNDNQTIGIPVGPDTSRILSEIVAGAIDATLKSKLKLTRARAVRHVDDWYIGFDSLGDAEDAVAKLSAVCRDFQLEIHPEKTKCIHSPREAAPIWPSILKNMRIETEKIAQRKSIDHFFNQAFYYATLSPRENVLGFAVSTSRRLRILPENWHLYETYLLKAARANSSTLPVIVQILTSYNSWGHPVNKERVGKLIVDLIRVNAPTASHAEVAWALFLAKALNITVTASALKPVTELESSVCALISLDLRSRGLIKGKLNTNLWQLSMTDAGLTSNMWLLAYEAELKGWLSGSTTYVDDNPYFKELKSRKVSFYNTTRNVTDIRKAKPRVPSPELARILAILATPSTQATPPEPTILESGSAYWGNGI